MIYEENHSFDNLYGGWGTVNGQQVEGLGRARRNDDAGRQDGTAYGCLQQHDVNLTTPAAADDLHGPRATASPRATSPTSRSGSTTTSRPRTRPARRQASFAAQRRAEGLPGALPGGCTRDLVHRFYQEQYQLDGGQQDRYVTGSDAVGLTMGYYDTKQLPIYRYLHCQEHRTTSSPTTSSRRRSAARSSTTSG